MKAMVLAAGFGKRLQPITDQAPKPTVPFFGRPLLLRTLDILKELGTESAVVNGHHYAHRVQGVLEQAPLPTVFSPEERILGTAGALWQARRHFETEELFLLVNGDIAFDLPLEAAISTHVASGAEATLLLLDNPDPTRYGPIVTRGSLGSGSALRIERIDPPSPQAAGYLYSGLAILSGQTLERLPDGPSELVPALFTPLARAGRLAGTPCQGSWWELGTPDDYRTAHIEVLRQVFGSHHHAMAHRLVDCPLHFDRSLRSAVHPTAIVQGEIDESVVDIGAEIGAGSIVRRSVLLPGARVDRDCEVVDQVCLPEPPAA